MEPIIFEQGIFNKKFEGKILQPTIKISTIV